MASEKEIFSLSGPSFLTAIDWNNSHHRRSVAACLVKGAYILERDRQLNRQGPQIQAPPWWQFFNFTLIKVLIDDHDTSYFGAIYEYNYPYPQYDASRPPRYVVAFRGTINKPGNREQDFKLNLHCIISNLQESSRFDVGLRAMYDLIEQVGPDNVWLAGHSLGSSIALLIGRYLVKYSGIPLETYLFNPPFASPPIELIKNEKIKHRLRFVKSFIVAGLALAANGGKMSKEDDPFVLLSKWFPYLFVNPCDPICSEYIGYFDHREKMESIGAGKIGRIATKYSALGSIISAAQGKSCEAAHLIPSAYVTVNSSVFGVFKEDHGINQWWRQDLDFNYRLYQYE